MDPCCRAEKTDPFRNLLKHREEIYPEMTGLYEKVVAVAAVVSVAVVRSSPVVGPEPIRCAPCTQEILNGCPAIPAGCKQELREPGCGCCMACALEKGASCGVHTAHCGEGLRCIPRPDEARPLYALTRGQGVCTEDPGQEDDGLIDPGSVHYLLSLNLPVDTQDTAEGQESIKARLNAIRSKLVRQGPCHTELHAALETITSSQQKLGEKFTTFYLPNCDKHGYYKAKQCESSLVGPPARCWCVSSWNGKKIPGSDNLHGNLDCNQEISQ